MGTFSQTRTRSPAKRVRGLPGFEVEGSLTMPVGDVLVGDTRSDVEHDDTALAVDVVAISQSTELFLPCCVPDIELNAPVVLSRMSM